MQHDGWLGRGDRHARLAAVCHVIVQGRVRELRAPARAGPAVLLGFYRPSLATPGSGVALEVLSDILAGARPPPRRA